MAATLTVRDETSMGEVTHEITLDFLTETVTLRELIRSRVYQEVKDYNSRLDGEFQGLVQPSEAEKTLNGYRLKPKRPIDWEKQFDKALEAFGTNGMIVLVDDRQLESLDEEIEIKAESSVSFLRLVPLVGG